MDRGFAHGEGRGQGLRGQARDRAGQHGAVQLSHAAGAGLGALARRRRGARAAVGGAVPQGAGHHPDRAAGLRPRRQRGMGKAGAALTPAPKSLKLAAAPPVACGGPVDPVAEAHHVPTRNR
ncbi:hypothetical protein CBM2599_B51108 [Cupriavidus taiwanensis]|nr:hypothetical protein CBM2599_B51108 [Cupriavidus taiwanensis]